MAHTYEIPRDTPVIISEYLQISLLTQVIHMPSSLFASATHQRRKFTRVNLLLFPEQGSPQLISQQLFGRSLEDVQWHIPLSNNLRRFLPRWTSVNLRLRRLFSIGGKQTYD
jgi:hypothetical protein